MEEETVDVVPQKSPKRKSKKDDKGDKSPKNAGQKKEVKKARLFYAKEFRKQLAQEDKLGALKRFLEAIKLSDGHDYIFDYLENGGNCLELLQILENNSTVPPAIIFELVTYLLLKISTVYTQYESSTYEACRFLINNYISVVHKMLGLSSSKEERKACLKLLTAMVAFSSNLAKDVLLNVKFHSANIELLTKHMQEKNSVRDCFIHFLTAFLVDGHEHILSILLEKGGLLTSIINGLQYDQADTVSIVITAMKNHILENAKVSRTAKMSVFNTSLIRDIVNLYNWRGPDGLKMLDKHNKTVFEVDKYEKSKVSECVHNFLIVLCTSHKFGVIFKDPLVGLGRKNQNALIYTVLESLAKPWEHSYASDLVINICKACPDLVKTVWSNLKAFLEPRLSEKWITALSFARKLLQTLEPSCIDHCAKTLSAQQLAQIVELLVSPLPILKTLLPDDNTYENPTIKQHISVFLFDMLEAIQNYLEASKSWADQENFKKAKNHLAGYVSKHFPDAQTLLNDWRELSEENETKFDYLGCILDILDIYRSVAPQLLCNLSASDLNLKDLLKNLNSLNEDNEMFELLQMKIVNLFLELDQTYFSPKSEMFQYIFPLLLNLYHKIKSKDILTVLVKLFKNTGIFDDSLYEINIWCNGILNFASIPDGFGEKLAEIIRNTTDNILEFHKEISDIKVQKSVQTNVDNVLENLLNMETELTNAPKHRHFSPFILGVFKDINTNGYPKHFKKYLEFVLICLLHLQTDLGRFIVVIENYKQNIPSNILEYLQKWCLGEPQHVQKFKGALKSFQTFSEQFLTGTINEDVLNESLYSNFKQDLLQTSIFYFDNLVNLNLLSDNHTNNFKLIINCFNSQNQLDNVGLKCILSNPNLIKQFDILNLNKANASNTCTETMTHVVKELKSADKNIEHFLKPYCDKIYHSILKVIKKPQKYGHTADILDILNVFHLNYNQVISIVKRITTILDGNCDITENILFNVLCYCLNRISELCAQNSNFKPLEKEQINILTTYFGHLAKDQKNICMFSKVFKRYLGVFPHNISDLDENFFSSVLSLNEYDKDNVDLLVFLVERHSKLTKHFEDQIEALTDKKGVLFPLTKVVINNKNNKILEKIYKVLEPSVLKALQKPQKVGQHFQKDYGISVLVEKYMEYEKCKHFTEKVQKFEVTEIFHAKLLEAVFNKCIENNLNEKPVSNMILSFVHLNMGLFKRKSKSDEDTFKVEEIAKIFYNLLIKIKSKFTGDLKNVAKNETFKTFTKFCLKFGVSGQVFLLKDLKEVIEILHTSLEQEDASLLLEMLLSHSEFLDVVLEEHNDVKLEVLSLILILCKHWPKLLDKNQVPIILSAYRGKITRCDRTILQLLKLYESKADQTRFYDLKPFLWGRAAATHYSVRSQIENSLIRQPKTSDVLDLIKEDLVRNTIKSYPFTDGLYSNENDVVADVEERQCYDLRFILPLFSHLLAPEQQVKTYKFTRCGALSLTVIGLSSNDKEVRQAACHVLSRFHFHLEARQTGKDNLLWIRYVQALCKGIAVLPNFKANNFAAIFFARMALVFTQPNHVMYQPLARYLSAKEELHLDTVPELYTLLHSADVNFKEHRLFVLEVLKDGLRNEQDFKDFLKSMAFKLFSELFSSCVSDNETKILILDVIDAACKLPLGVKVLCGNHSLLAQINSSFCTLLFEKKTGTSIFPKYINILLKIINARTDKMDSSLVFNVIFNFVNSESFKQLKPETVAVCYEILYKLFDKDPKRFSTVRMNHLLNLTDDTFCKYVQKYGSTFVLEQTLNKEGNKHYFLQLLVIKFFNSR